MDCFELSKSELDMAILGELHAAMKNKDTCGPSHKHKPTQSSVSYKDDQYVPVYFGFYMD